MSWSQEKDKQRGGRRGTGWDWSKQQIVPEGPVCLPPPTGTRSTSELALSYAHSRVVFVVRRELLEPASITHHSSSLRPNEQNKPPLF